MNDTGTIDPGDDAADPGLAAVLARATDRLERPFLAERALVRARRRARGRRVVAAVATAAAAVAVVGVAVGLPGRDARTDQRLPATSGPAPEAGDPVQARWDPFTVVAAPLADSALPERLAPPARPPAVADDPMSAALVAWPEPGHDVRVLGSDGRWRALPGTTGLLGGTLRDVVEPVISPAGDRVAMATEAGVLVVDVTSGEQATIPWPERLAGPWDTAPGLRWLPDGEGFVVLHWRGTWLLTADGAARSVPYGGSYGLGVAVDPAGPVVEKRWEQQDLRVWREDELQSSAPFPWWGERPVAGHGMLALTGGGNGLPGDGGPMVVDTATGELVAYAPIRDRSSVYSDNGHLTAQGFLDERTLLLLVGPADFRTMEIGEEGWHLVAWDLDTGGFTRLTSGAAQMRGIDVAVEVLAAEW